MKKISKIILVLFLFCSIWGCSKPQEEAVEENSVTYEERDVDYSTDLPAFGEDSIAIHYQRNDNLYEKWTLWIWDVDGSDDDSEDDFNYQDDYGVIAYYPLSHFGDSGLKRLGIIVKNKGTWSVKDGTDADRFIELSQYAKDENGVYHVYLAQDDAHIYNSADKTINDSINSAVFTGENTIYIGCSNKVESYQIFADGELVFEGNGAGRTKFTDKVDFYADFAKNYTVKVIFRESNTELESKVDTSGLYSTDAFDEMYYYDGELGAIYSAKSTEFRAWSPISSSIELRIYDSGTPKSVSSKGDDTYTAVAMSADKPILGICRGIQFINAILGGTLYQDITKQHPSSIEHHQVPPYDIPVHEVDVVENSPLQKCLGISRLSVNSYHHQAVKRIAPELSVMAVSTDGIIEALYRPNSRFLWAVQWHPEFSYKTDTNSRKIFKAFIEGS